MKKVISSLEAERIVQRTMEEAWERSAVPPLRDVLKREYDEAQKRPRDVAWEKWGPKIEAEIERDLERERQQRQIKKDGSDMDMG